MKIINNKKGLTLIELLIGSVLLLVIIFSLLSLFLQQQKLWFKTELSVQLQQDASIALEELSQSIRVAGYMLPPTVQPMVIFNNTGTPDSIIIRGNFSHFSSTLGYPALVGTKMVYATRDSTFAYIPGMSVFIAKDTLLFASPVDSFFTFLSVE
jgi:Tfp pilus assembly protein PilW